MHFVFEDGFDSRFSITYWLILILLISIASPYTGGILHWTLVITFGVIWFYGTVIISARILGAKGIKSGLRFIPRHKLLSYELVENYGLEVVVTLVNKKRKVKLKADSVRINEIERTLEVYFGKR